MSVLSDSDVPSPGAVDTDMGRSGTAQLGLVSNSGPARVDIRTS
jgi:hypothetical protein